MGKDGNRLQADDTHTAWYSITWAIMLSAYLFSLISNQRICVNSSKWEKWKDFTIGAIRNFNYPVQTLLTTVCFCIGNVTSCSQICKLQLFLLLQLQHVIHGWRQDVPSKYSLGFTEFDKHKQLILAKNHYFTSILYMKQQHACTGSLAFLLVSPMVPDLLRDRPIVKSCGIKYLSRVRAS